MDNLEGIEFVCSWCPDHVERTQEARDKGKEVTHGLCRYCKAAYFKETSTHGKETSH